VAIRYVALFTSTIMRKLLAKPNVKLFNTVGAEDLIVKGGRVAGVVTNWALGVHEPRHAVVHGLECDGGQGGGELVRPRQAVQGRRGEVAQEHQDD